jgi:hypothetical protein
MSFSQCHRCGTDLVFADHGWATPPPGHRVVWRPRTAGTAETAPSRSAETATTELPLGPRRLDVGVTVTYRRLGEAQDVRRRFASRFGRSSVTGEIIITSPIYADEPPPWQLRQRSPAAGDQNRHGEGAEPNGTQINQGASLQPVSHPYMLSDGHKNSGYSSGRSVRPRQRNEFFILAPYAESESEEHYG